MEEEQAGISVIGNREVALTIGVPVAGDHVVIARVACGDDGSGGEGAVSLSGKEADIVEAEGRSGEVGEAIAIEVVGDDGVGIAVIAAGVGLLGSECAGASRKENADGIRVVVGGCDIRLAVSVDVRDNHGGGTVAGRKVDGGRERSIAKAAEETDRITIEVRDHGIRNGVIIEIACGKAVGRGARGEVQWVIEGTVAAAEPDTERGGTAVGDEDIRAAVAIEVAQRDAEGIGTGGVGNGWEESACAIAEEHADGGVVVVGDDRVGEGIAIEETGGNFVRIRSSARDADGRHWGTVRSARWLRRELRGRGRTVIAARFEDVAGDSCDGEGAGERNEAIARAVAQGRTDRERVAARLEGAIEDAEGGGQAARVALAENVVRFVIGVARNAIGSGIRQRVRRRSIDAGWLEVFRESYREAIPDGIAGRACGRQRTGGDFRRHEVGGIDFHEVDRLEADAFRRPAEADVVETAAPDSDVVSEAGCAGGGDRSGGIDQFESGNEWARGWLDEIDRNGRAFALRAEPEVIAAGIVAGEVATDLSRLPTAGSLAQIEDGGITGGVV